MCVCALVPFFLRPTRLVPLLFPPFAFGRARGGESRSSLRKRGFLSLSGGCERVGLFNTSGTRVDKMSTYRTPEISISCKFMARKKLRNGAGGQKSRRSLPAINWTLSEKTSILHTSRTARADRHISAVSAPTKWTRAQRRCRLVGTRKYQFHYH